MRTTWRAGLSLGAVLVLAVVAANAEPFDHLQCWKIRPDHGVKGLVDLTPFAAGLPANADCRIKGPRLYCSAVAKTNPRTEPPTVGAPAGAQPGDMLCYKAKCAAAPPARTVSDQFGTFTIVPKRTFVVCAPVAPPSSSTTTTPVTTTTTTTDGAPGCATSSPPVCGGPCPPGDVCQALGVNDPQVGVVTFCACVPAGGACDDCLVGGPCAAGSVCGAFIENGQCLFAGCVPFP